MKKKVWIWIGASVAVFVIIAVSILLGILVPVHGTMNDTEYWSEYDTFRIEDIPTMEVGADGIRILQLTDLHYHLPHMTGETDNIVKQLVAENNPDLIVITGDSVFGPTNVMYTKHVAKLMDSFGIPWAIVYGNHDDEGKADKYWMGEVYENSQYGIYRNGPCNIGGTGNYALNLTKDGQPFYSMIMMDSNSSIQYNGKKEYGAFTPSQVAWYGWLQDGLKSAGYDKSMMFFHVPFPEFLDAYEAWEASGFDPSMGSGSKNEGVCSAPYNPGMFEKIKEKQATTHVFAGHDHVNDFDIEYQGITLTYGVKSSRQFYFDQSMIGGTVIQIDGDRNVTIERKYLDVQ